MTPSTSAARSLDSRGKPLPNSPFAEDVRRALQLGLPHGAQAAIAAASGRSLKAVQKQIEGANALTVDVFLASLPFLGDAGPLRKALRRAGLFFPLPPARGRRFLPTLLPAVSEVFSRTGRLAEEVSLAERDGVLTEAEADAIDADCEQMRALVESIEESADVAAGRRLA